MSRSVATLELSFAGVSKPSHELRAMDNFFPTGDSPSSHMGMGSAMPMMGGGLPAPPMPNAESSAGHSTRINAISKPSESCCESITIQECTEVSAVCSAVF